jgi:hypothetical protein
MPPPNGNHRPVIGVIKPSTVERVLHRRADRPRTGGFIMRDDSNEKRAIGNRMDSCIDFVSGYFIRDHKIGMGFGYE